jgi:hypothetical protein
MVWYACLQDVLPALTNLNVLFHPTIPLPLLHIPCTKTSVAKATLMNMVDEGGTRSELISLDTVDINTTYGAYANKFIKDHSGQVEIRGFGRRLDVREVVQLKKSWYKSYAHCLAQIGVRFPTEREHGVFQTDAG